MKEKTINLSNFPHTRLPRTQLAILKYAAKTTDSSKHDEKIDTYDGCFEEPRKLQSGTLVEYKGVVPDDVRALADMGNLDENNFCVNCGMPKPVPSNNHCSNPDCQYHDVILEDSEQKYCGKCGAATTYWKEIESMC